MTPRATTAPTTTAAPTTAAPTTTAPTTTSHATDPAAVRPQAAAPHVGPPRRRLAKVASALLAFLLVATGGYVAAGSLVSMVMRTTTTIDSPVTALRVILREGTARVVGHDEPTTVVHQTVTRSLRAPTQVLESRGGTLMIRTACHGVIMSCTSDVEVRVPRSAAVRVQVGIGRAEATGLIGPAALTVRRGDVTARAVTGPLTLATTTGRVVAEEIGSSSVLATSRRGTVTVGINGAFEQLRVSSGGNAVVRVADPGGSYQIHARAAEERWVQLPAGDDGPVIDVSSVAGSVFVGAA